MNHLTLLLICISCLACSNERASVVKEEEENIQKKTTGTDDKEAFLTFEVNPKNAELKLFWKDNNGEKIKTFSQLRSYLSSNQKTLLFAMNGGMYTKKHDPQGLYIEDGQVLKRINTVQKAYGNFYMQPNGIFHIDKSKAASVTQTKDINLDSTIEYATQSGPMLVIDSQIHATFTYQSIHLNIRNGVGILPNGNVLFAMSKQEVNFYDFAQFFLSKGCKNALYLDGFVSRCYLPKKNWEQLEGEFGVLIGVFEGL